MAHDQLSRLRSVNDLDEALKEKQHLEQEARAGRATQARLIGLERRIATAQATIHSYKTEP